MPRYTVVNLEQLPAVPCPCGVSRRGLADVAEFPGTLHRTDIQQGAQAHYHQRLTETYYILECSPGAFMELDGDRIPIAEGTCIVIPPGVVHRLVGKARILNIVLPKFDPADEVLASPS